MKLLANWDEKDNYIYNSDTIKQNFELFLKCDIDSPREKYIKSCIGLFCGFFKELEELCIKFNIDIFNINNELNFISISPKAMPLQKPFNELLVALSDENLKKLFDFLTTEKKSFSKRTFIDKDTDEQSFNYLFGGKEKPKQFKPIKWKANKQFLIDLLTRLQKEVTYNKQNIETRELSNDIKRQTKTFFIDCKTSEGLVLPKNNNRLKNRAEYKEIIKFFAGLELLKNNNRLQIE